MNQFYKKFSIVAFAAGNAGAQMGGWFRKEIKELADLRGLKFRVGGFAGMVLAKLGLVPVQIAGGEIYQALERGTIDAAEWVGPHDDAKLGFEKIAPYYYYPGWWEGGLMLHNFINLAKWETLPPAYKTIIKNASSVANEWMVAAYDAANPDALEAMLNGGVVQFRTAMNSVLQIQGGGS